MFPSEYQVKIECGPYFTFEFTKYVENFDELKSAFLKRFGNIDDVSNKALKEKPYVKKLTYEAVTIEEWCQSLYFKTRWKLNVKKV